MKTELEALISEAVKELFNVEVSIELTRPEEQFGDYATNVALQLSKQVGKSPREIGEQLAEKLRNDLSNHVSEVTVAGPGFLNLKLTVRSLLKLAQTEPKRTLEGQTVVAEYSDPNPFKVLHAGHLYTSIVGDSIANLLELAGANVHRVNFGGDVGLHVGKTMWVILNRLGGENLEGLNQIENKSEWLASAYVEGTNAYEDNEDAKQAIVDLNKRVYQLHTDNDHESAFAQIYWTTRQWSYDYFNEFYARIGSTFEKYYPESETAPIGLQTVREHTPDVYEESDGAIVFDGEKHGLHTRVFINSEGIPTYEAKDVGLIILKKQDYNFDRSVVITGNEQAQYMQVVLKSIEQFAPELTKATTHLTHGLVKLQSGEKMSSRKGNILRAVDVLDAAGEANKELNDQENEDTVLGAVKYSFLKNRMGGDTIYDPKESVSLEGNSGPYLQYAHARARSILSKSNVQAELSEDLEDGERSLLRKIAEFSEVIDKSIAEMMPHSICTYIYELSQSFNFFYEHNRVIDDPREGIRVALITSYADRLRQGLTLLGIASPDKM